MLDVPRPVIEHPARLLAARRLRIGPEPGERSSDRGGVRHAHSRGL